MNPLIGLQTGWNPNTPTVSTNQGMPGLMGNVLQQPTIPSLMNTSPGDWSQVAYNMAGRPIQGPYPSVTPPPMPAGVANGTQSSGGSSIGGTALGLLGALAKNPSLLKSGVNAISSLFGGGAGLPSGAAAAINSSALGGLEPVGTGAVDAAADSAAADASAALADSGSSGLLGGATAYGTDAAVAPAAGTAATNGLMAGGDAAASDVSSAAGGLGAGAGALAAGGLFAIPAILASTVATHDRSAAQYASMLSSLNAGPKDPGYNGAAMEIAADIASGQTGEYPAAVLQKAQQLGLYQTAQDLGAWKGAVGSNLRASKNQQ